MTLSIVPVYAGIAAFVLAFLSFRVIRLRRRAGVGIGAGGNRGLERAIRVQGNFTEYAPFALLLLAMAELSGQPAVLLHILCALLLLGRGIHAFGVSREPENYRFRVTGMVLTLIVLLTCGAVLVSGGSLLGSLLT